MIAQRQVQFAQEFYASHADALKAWNTSKAADLFMRFKRELYDRLRTEFPTLYPEFVDDMTTDEEIQPLFDAAASIHAVEI